MMFDVTIRSVFNNSVVEKIETASKGLNAIKRPGPAGDDYVETLVL